jgi:hypothetical protein
MKKYRVGFEDGTEKTIEAKSENDALNKISLEVPDSPTAWIRDAKGSSLKIGNKRPGFEKAGAVIRLNGGNDVNGNPRRVFIQLSNTGLILDAWDEDYFGESAIPEDHRKNYSGLTLAVTPGTYRDVIKNYTKRRK